MFMIVVLGANIVLAIWERHWAHKLDSGILLADASHTISDILTTIVGW